jgi:hypothetical protein
MESVRSGRTRRLCHRFQATFPSHLITDRSGSPFSRRSPPDLFSYPEFSDQFASFTEGTGFREENPASDAVLAEVVPVVTSV